MACNENEFEVERLLYNCELNTSMQKFLENVKLIASQRDAMFSAIEFQNDHPVEKAVRAILAATVMHLDLGMLQFSSLQTVHQHLHLLVTTLQSAALFL